MGQRASDGTRWYIVHEKSFRFPRSGSFPTETCCILYEGNVAAGNENALDDMVGYIVSPCTAKVRPKVPRPTHRTSYTTLDDHCSSGHDPANDIPIPTGSARNTWSTQFGGKTGHGGG